MPRHGALRKPREFAPMPQSMTPALPLVMITGASSGIGRALALSFAREGHPLLLISRHMEPIAGLPADTVYRQADVADYAAMTAAVAAAEAVHGPVECLVNNAGMADAREFDQVEEPDYTRELDTNLKGVFNGTKAVLAGMKRGNPARSSTSARSATARPRRSCSPTRPASMRCAPSASRCARRKG